MSTNEIDAAALAAAVRVWLQDEALACLEGAAHFNARVSANALAVVERELELRRPAEERESHRLRAFLQTTETDLATLRTSLIDHVRGLSERKVDKALLCHLRETTLDKLQIDQPSYSAYRRARPAG